jgi:vacuolar-type H+-ATPase subunit I/STV1
MAKNKLNKKGFIPPQLIFMVVSFGLGVFGVYVLGRIGMSFGVPGSLAYIISMAAMFGTLKVLFKFIG